MYRLLLIIWLESVLCFPVLYAQQQKETVKAPYFVMILNAYPYEKEWSTALAKEIRNILEMNDARVNVHITYAGINGRHSYLADRFSMQGAFAYGRLNNQITIPNVLVLIGDESWMIYRIMKKQGRWDNTAVVLCGIHPKILKDYKDYFSDKQIADTSLLSLKESSDSLVITAVMEPDNSAQTLKLAQTLIPQLQQLCYVSDGSYWDTYQKKKLAAAIRNSTAPAVSLTELLIKRSNADSAYQALAHLPAKTVIVTNGVPIPETIRIPVLTLRDMSYGNHNPIGGFFAPISDFARKTADAVFRSLNNKTQNDSYLFVSDTAYQLNRTALMNAELTSRVSELSTVVNRKIPPSFFFRHIRLLVVILLFLIVVTFAVARTLSSRRHRSSLKAVFDRYKSLYEVSQAIYETIPIGLMRFDMQGNLLRQNAEADAFLNQYLHSSETESFQLFESNILNNKMKTALFRKELVNQMIVLKPSCFRVLLRIIADEEADGTHILGMVIDCTDIEKEKEAEKQIYTIFNFAMNQSFLGVAEYNLMDNKGFATDAWYDLLNIKRGSTNFSAVHCHLIPADRERVEQFLASARKGVPLPFLKNLQMCTITGETHYIRYLIQPLEFAPDKKRIIVSELIMGMDEQIAREHELEAAMKKAKETDRLKNAFVANMKEEIREPMKEIVSCAQELTRTTDMARKTELNNRIEKNNEIILNLLEHIIDVSKVELTQ